MSAAVSEAPRIPGREIFGHPAGLYVLFFTEAWERFCYYGMRALLALYVAKELARPEIAPTVLGFTALQHGLAHIFGPLDNEQLADQVYGLYTAAVYLTPFFGGILADRLIGQRKSVVIGGVLMATGEFMLMKVSWFLPAVAILTIGNGFFKSNISTQVGALYPPGDSRRDRAFNIFYVGINLGAFLSPFICGTLGEKVGWAWGFGSAGVGLLIGLAVYLWGSKFLAPDQIMQKRAGAAKKAESPFTKSEWARITALIVLCALNISFWGVYEQQGNSLQFWADGSSNRHVLGWLGSNWEMPATWFQALNPIFIIAGTPVINWIWTKQAAKKKEPSSVAKMAIGCFLLGASFLVMIPAGHKVDAGGLASFNYLIGCTFLLTLGELYLSPVGLSLVTKIAPPRIVSMMMGMWFLSSCVGDYLSGYLATFTHKMSSPMFFIMLSGISLATGVLMILFYAPLKKAIGDENAKVSSEAEAKASELAT